MNAFMVPDDGSTPQVYHVEDWLSKGMFGHWKRSSALEREAKSLILNLGRFVVQTISL